MNYLKEVPKKQKNIPYRKIEGNIYIVDPRKKRLHELNEVASFIWENIDGRNSWFDILDKILKNFDVKKDVATEDITYIREVFLDKGLIQV